MDQFCFLVRGSRNGNSETQTHAPRELSIPEPTGLLSSVFSSSCALWREVDTLSFEVQEQLGYTQVPTPWAEVQMHPAWFCFPFLGEFPNPGDVTVVSVAALLPCSCAPGLRAFLVRPYCRGVAPAEHPLERAAFVLQLPGNHTM
jgi:hypothetical protein